MDLSEIKKLVEAQGAAWEEYRKTNEAMLKAKAEGKAVADLEVKLQKLDEAMTNAAEKKATLERLDDLEKKLNRQGLTGGSSDEIKAIEIETKSFNVARRAMASTGAVVTDVTPDQYVAYKSAFEQFARRGPEALVPEMKTALQAGSDPDGGYLLPPSTVGRIVKKVYEMSPIRSYATVVPISGDALEGLNDLDEAAAGWVSELGARNDTNTPQVGKYRLEAHEMYAQPKASQRILDDAATDIEAWLSAKVSDKFARVEAASFITGDGQGKAKGLFKYPTAATADASRAWGTFEHVKTGANGAFLTNGTGADCLIDLTLAFKAYYMQNARWLTNRQVIALLRKLKESTTNAYLWQPGLQAGQPDRLLGMPVVIDQEVPALATGSLSMGLGDIAETYTIVDRIGIRTLRDPYTDKPWVKFYSTRRVGGGVTNFESFKFIDFAA